MIIAILFLLAAGSAYGTEIVIGNEYVVTVIPADEPVIGASPFSGLLPTPIIISPANGTTFRHLPRTMVLAWRPVFGADAYQVELDSLSGDSWVRSGTVTVSGWNNTFCRIEVPGDYSVRWRVTALGNWQGFAAESRPSPWWRFSWDAGQTLATPVQVSPGGGAVFSHYPRMTILSWDPVPGATGYLLERDILSGSAWTPYPDVVVPGEQNSAYLFTFDTTDPCRWRVTAVDGTAFRNSTASPWWQFSFDK